MDNSLCEKEFLRIGLSFWTGEDQGARIQDLFATFDSHTAASVGDLEFLGQVAPTELDRSNWSGWTPLMYGCYHGHQGLVSSLIGRECDLTRTNNKGRTPLILAAMCGNREIASLVLSSSSTSSRLLGASDQRNMTALSHAVRWGHLQVAQDLLEAGSDPDITEHTRGHSLLMMAAQEGNLAMAELLLSFNADPSYQTVLGDTAFTVAEARGHQAIAGLILKSSPSSLSSLSAPARLRVMMEQKRLSERPSTVSELLRQLGLEKYDEMFEENEIDLPLLLTMSDLQLRQVGIIKLGPRRKLTAAIGRMKEENNGK